jgi:hypothetical protein
MYAVLHFSSAQIELDRKVQVQKIRITKLR